VAHKTWTSLLVGVLVVFLTVIPARADPLRDESNDLCTQLQMIDLAYLNNNLETLEDLKQKAGGTDYWGRYVQAFASYRMTLVSLGDPDIKKKVSKNHNNVAIDLLLGLLDEREEAEVLALLSNAYGLKIAMKPISGITTGPKAARTGERALELAPENPRMLLTRGQTRFNAPGFAGGDKEEALRLFRAAVTGFENDEDPCWGETDAKLALAQALAEENPARALEILEGLLEEWPAFREADVLRMRLTGVDG